MIGSNKYGLAAAILRHKWAISHEVALSFGPLVYNLLSRNSIETRFEESFNPEINKEDQTPIVSMGDVTYFKANKWTDFSSMPFGSVAVINIEGPLMKNDQYCGSYGMASKGDIIRKADNSKNVAAIVLRIDSPGGTVDGTKDLADIIKQVSKPVVSFADGLMASAAMWIGSAADEIFASQDHAEVGSIGVLMSFADMQPMWEKEGIVFHKIVSSLSPDKTKMFDDLRKGEYEEYRKTVLDPLAEEFINTIKENRPNVTDEHTTGKVFFAKDVVGSLVDQIGSLDEAIIRAKELSEIQTNSNKKNITSMENINKVLGIESLEMVDGHASLNEEQLNLIETAIATASGSEEITQANEERDQAQADLSTANETIKQKDETIKDLENKVADLEKKPGAETAKIVVEKEVIEEKSGEDKPVSDDSKSFIENVKSVASAYLQ